MIEPILSAPWMTRLCHSPTAELARKLQNKKGNGDKKGLLELGMAEKLKREPSQNVAADNRGDQQAYSAPDPQAMGFGNNSQYYGGYSLLPEQHNGGYYPAADNTDSFYWQEFDR